MTQEKQARPEALSKRAGAKASAKPTPAEDETVDPVSLPEARPVPEQPFARLSRQQPTVQLGVRVPEDVAEMVAAQALRQGVTKRQVIEDLVRQHLGGGR